VDIVRTTMMQQAGPRLHHPTGVNRRTCPRPTGRYRGSPG
jgi:hypothetical protein